MLGGIDSRFRVQGHYPNLRTLMAGLGRRAQGGGARLPGSSAAVIEYAGEGGHVQELGVRESDLVLIAHSPWERVAEHCDLITRARGGDAEAAAVLAERNEDLSRRLERAHQRAASAESRLLVPSTSEQEHPAELVSDKGQTLLKLGRLGYPVPDFVIITSESYLESEEDRRRRLQEALEVLAAMTGRESGLSDAPLVFALRCAMPNYYPGVMPTFLNVGVTESSFLAFERVFGPEAALKMYLNNLRNLVMALDRNVYTANAGRFRADLTERARAEAVLWASGIVRRHDPALLTDMFYQTSFFVREGYRYFESNQDLLLTLSRGKRHLPALILQQMVCTARGEESYAGVLFSRHSRTGVGLQLETARGVFGEEIMTGGHGTEQTAFADGGQIKESFPAVHHFLPKLGELERQLEAPAMLEFAVETAGSRQLFALLQANAAGLTGRAAVIAVTDLHQAGVISRKRVMELICPYHIKQLESDTIDPQSIPKMARFCGGVSILPRAAVSAQIYFSAEAALAGKRRGEKVCFAKRSYGPGDTVVMQEMDAILSLTSAAIHVVTICQGFGSPSLLSLETDGVRLDEERRCLINAAGDTIQEGDWVTLSSRRQALYKGRARFTPARLLSYMRGEQVPLDEEEKPVFKSLAYAYHYYQRLMRATQTDQISRLSELVRIVNLDLRGADHEARTLINGWFDGREGSYVEEVLRCELGDHLSQHRVFSMLTLERKIRFFKSALRRCASEKLTGYTAGAFMLGRFLSTPLPADFWRALGSLEIGLAANEWVLFEKYLQILFDVGERHVSRARKTILHGGMGDISLTPRRVMPLLPARLAGCDLEAARALVPDWADLQAQEVLDLLRRPYSDFFLPDDPASRTEFEKLCREAGVAVPVL